MDARCQYSEIRLPNNPSFGPAIAGYVAEVARIIGFEETELPLLEQGVLTAFTALIEYSFEPDENALLTISCESVAGGLKVTLKDQGLPFGAEEMPPGGDACPVGNTSRLCSRIFGLYRNFDEIRLQNLGPEGKETVLVRHLKSGALAGYYPACDLDPYEEKIVSPAPSAEEMKWQVRQVRPPEAAEVSKLVYKAYGYTYAYPYVYYPEKIAAMNESGEIHSAVALTANDEMAGHAVLQYFRGNPRIAELAQAVVKPEFRSRGCLRAMTEYLVQVADKKGLLGVFTKSLTEHLFSQKTAHRFGFKDCAVLLGIIPPGTEFRGIKKPLVVRGSILIQFRYLHRPPGLACFVPPGHRDMITRIYENLGVAAEIRPEPSITPGGGESILEVEIIGTLRFARIALEKIGADAVTRVKIKLRELCFQKFEIIHLHLNLGDPGTSRLSDAFEGLGFFFAGLLPGGFTNGDALIFQFLNNLRIHYQAVHLQSELAREMLSYIKGLDPNRS